MNSYPDFYQLQKDELEDVLRVNGGQLSGNKTILVQRLEYLWNNYNGNILWPQNVKDIRFLPKKFQSPQTVQTYKPLKITKRSISQSPILSTYDSYLSNPDLQTARSSLTSPGSAIVSPIRSPRIDPTFPIANQLGGDVPQITKFSPPISHNIPQHIISPRRIVRSPIVPEKYKGLTLEELNDELVKAIDESDVNEINVLLSMGANTNEGLFISIIQGDLEMTKFFISKGANDLNGPLLFIENEYGNIGFDETEDFNLIETVQFLISNYSRNIRPSILERINSILSNDQ